MYITFHILINQFKDGRKMPTHHCIHNSHFGFPRENWRFHTYPIYNMYMCLYWHAHNCVWKLGPEFSEFSSLRRLRSTCHIETIDKASEYLQKIIIVDLKTFLFLRCLCVLYCAWQIFYFLNNSRENGSKYIENIPKAFIISRFWSVYIIFLFI